MKTVNVPMRAEVSSTNQALFDSLHKGLGFVPNLYATLAHSGTALGTYLALQNAKSSLNAKEREVINLVVSQFNDCHYCLAAHTALGKMHGFSDAQIIEIRRGAANFARSWTPWPGWCVPQSPTVDGSTPQRWNVSMPWAMPRATWSMHW